MTRDRPVLGIVLMLGFCVLAPLGDAVAKLLGSRMGVGELVFLRFLFQLVILAPFALTGARAILRDSFVLGMTALRTLLHILGIGCMFLALRYLPLAEAVAIAFVMPFIMLLLGRYVLGEEVGPRRIAACAMGFVGTLLVVQPSFAAVGPAALLPLAVAVVFALFMLVTRTIAKKVDPIALQAVSGAMACLVLVPLLLLTEGLPPVPGDPATLGLILALGTLGTVAHLLMTWSLRFAPSATLAPMQYLEIPFATLIGWMIFRDLPNGLAALGIGVTMAAGLYIIHRERRAGRGQPPAGSAAAGSPASPRARSEG
ncbi:Riboflavin transporter [Pseudoruegeria aquimaris]|uniref:Riboflavin transporter n=1 Tax=Pseudoruegeria aquimaris TaxID=393663 RepID=A0A1Y5RGW6_9RHOB|nr:DMT family transporter [Pseudoruegeria aquimaris]SLN16912.1 Riboflavin transporter [Pseudoruegeria aquimaris]